MASFFMKTADLQGKSLAGLPYAYVFLWLARVQQHVRGPDPPPMYPQIYPPSTDPVPHHTS